MSEKTYSERIGGEGLYARHHLQRFKWLSDQIAALQKESVSILELGCYDGKTLDYIPTGVHRYLGFDGGQESGVINGKACGLEAARRRFADHKNYSFQQSVDPSDIANITEKFDVIISLQTFEYIEPASKVESYLAAFADKLEGFLLLTVSNERGLALLFKTLVAKLLGVSRPSYNALEFANALLGRMDRVRGCQCGIKGFDYVPLAKSLERHFRYVELEGISLLKLPVQLSPIVGMIAGQKPIPC